jgi:dihydroflavonol-4-reductase
MRPIRFVSLHTGDSERRTLRVLRAAAASGVQRVVFTSSGYAVKKTARNGEKHVVEDEDTWTDLNDKSLTEYGKSKALAERAVWDFLDTNGSTMTVATVIPGLTLGPVMGRTASPSLQMVSRLLTGTLPAIPDVSFAISDSRDLADLHIRAMLSPEAANQRFIGAGETLWFAEIADILRRHLPERKAIPTRHAPDWLIRVLSLFQQDARLLVPMLGVREEMNAEKAARLLQWKPRSSEETVINCADSLIANKHV